MTLDDFRFARSWKIDQPWKLLLGVALQVRPESLVDGLNETISRTLGRFLVGDKHLKRRGSFADLVIWVRSYIYIYYTHILYFFLADGQIRGPFVWGPFFEGTFVWPIAWPSDMLWPSLDLKSSLRLGGVWPCLTYKSGGWFLVLVLFGDSKWIFATSNKQPDGRSLLPRIEAGPPEATCSAEEPLEFREVWGL